MSLMFSSNASPEPEESRTINQEEGEQEEQEMGFSIRRALGGRRGWKIMADDGEMVDGLALRRIVTIIKDMELQVGIKHI